LPPNLSAPARPALRRKPVKLFYVLLVLLISGVTYCAHDQLGLFNSPAPAQVVLRIDPDSSPAHLARGQAMYGRGEIEPAIDQFTDAYILDPTSFQANYDLMLSLSQFGRFDPRIARGINAADAVLIQPNSAKNQINLSAVLENRHHLNAAVARARQAVQLDVNSPAAYFALGVLCYEQKDFNQAIHELSQTLRQQPNYPQAREILRAALVARGDSPPEADDYISHL